MDTITGSLYGVWGSSDSDVYAVGWEFFDDALLHYDGSTWSSMNRGAGHWARGLILHYDGCSWSSMDSGTSYWLRGVWGSSNRNVFAVGWNGTIMHYDGRRWSNMSSGVTDDLIWIWGIPDSDVFAVGMEGAILHHIPVSHLTIQKDVVPVGLVPYQGAITYTVVLGNNGTGGATGAVITDALSAEVDFFHWLERPGDARVESDEITWGGKVEAGEAITLSFVVDHVGNYGDVVTNTAVYSHASGGGSDDATFKYACLLSNWDLQSSAL